MKKKKPKTKTSNPNQSNKLVFNCLKRSFKAILKKILPWKGPYLNFLKFKLFIWQEPFLLWCLQQSETVLLSKKASKHCEPETTIYSVTWTAVLHGEGIHGCHALVPIRNILHWDPKWFLQVSNSPLKQHPSGLIIQEEERTKEKSCKEGYFTRNKSPKGAAPLMAGHAVPSTPVITSLTGPMVRAFPSHGFCKSKILSTKVSTQLRCGNPTEE